MEILKFPHPTLSEVCTPVTVFGEELKILLDAMWDTMKSTTGMGLAANQVGLTFRMFVMEGNEGERIYLVNPEILKKSLAISAIKEGCLSAPGEMIQTNSRAEWVQVRYYDESGNYRNKVFTDVYSVCVQHEIDHLNGKSFMEIKTIPKSKRKELAKKWGLK